MSDDVKYVLKRVLVGVLIFLCISFIKTRKVEALSTVGFNTWEFVYRDNTVGQNWNNSFIYRLGEQKSLLAVNVYWPSFQGYYNGTLTIQFDPAQFPNGSLKLTNQYFKLFVYQNNSYSQQYYIGTCDGDLTCTFNFQGTAEQLNTNNFSVQLLINNDAFSTAYIFYPAARISASVYVSDESNSGNNDIINNQNENTQNIINNQNENTDKEIESQKVCKFIDKSNIFTDNKFLNSSGQYGNSEYFGITDFLDISDSEIIVSASPSYQYSPNFCFYDISKNLVSCQLNSSLTSSGQKIDIPSNSYYVRFSIAKNTNLPTYKICKNGNQALNDILSDPDVSPGLGQDYFTNFSDDNPLTNIVLFPVHLLQSATSTCSPFSLSVINQNVSIPCGNTIFWDKPYASSFRTWWNLFVGGIAIYYLGLKLFKTINNAIDPFKDDFEHLGGM